MNYSDFFHLFYRKRHAGGLKGQTSKSKIVEFFFKATIDDADQEKLLPTSDSSFEKWFDGDPRRKLNNVIWTNIIQCSKTNELSKKSSIY